MGESYMGGGGGGSIIGKTLLKQATAAQAALPPPPPNPNDAVTAASLEEVQANQRKNRGRGSTQLTGAGGLTGSATTSARTLLGS